MRIDDENKVVVPDFVADYIEKFYDDKEPTSWDKADLIRDRDNYISVDDRKDVAEWVKNADNFLKFVIAIATDNYIIEPQKYYWRKKKEHFASFENNCLIVLRSNVNGVLAFGSIATYNNSIFEAKFTEQEARELLKDDFNMFEKVECE